jgi:hypothetical protein
MSLLLRHVLPVVCHAVGMTFTTCCVTWSWRVCSSRGCRHWQMQASGGGTLHATRIEHDSCCMTAVEV